MFKKKRKNKSSLNILNDLILTNESKQVEQISNTVNLKENDDLIIKQLRLKRAKLVETLSLIHGNQPKPKIESHETAKGPEKVISLSSSLNLLDHIREDLNIFDTGDVEASVARPIGGANRSEMHSAETDSDGYYSAIPGEILAERYKVVSKVGRGVFSTVVKALDVSLQGETHVAIKIMRGNEAMSAVGAKEKQILELLATSTNLEAESNVIIKLKNAFYHGKHYCLVFELADRNLREVLSLTAKKSGISLQAVRAYAQQALFALQVLRRCSILHGDLKPDNFVVSNNNMTLKLCDFGSALALSDAQVAPYLVSRFYRAPEVILGLPYDFAIDMWSLGCTLFELFTGQLLFPGKSNHDMLKLFVSTLGQRIPATMAKRSPFFEKYFNAADANLLDIQLDPVTKTTMYKTWLPPSSEADNISIRKRVLKAVPSSWTKKDPNLGTSSAITSNGKFVHYFIDFLEKIMVFYPDKRLKVDEAYHHKFVKFVF